MTQSRARSGNPSEGSPTEIAIDASGFSTREINARLHFVISKDARPRITISNPGARHNLAVGLMRSCSITFEGSVGYYCLSFCDGVEALVKGNAGWGLGDNLMSGRIVVSGSTGSSTGASMRGGEIVVLGNAGARTGISMKGGSMIVGGNSGFLTGFMMQKGRIIVLGDLGSAAGDSMYEGAIYFGGAVESLGADAQVERVSQKEKDEVARVLSAAGIANSKIPRSFKKITSKKKLYHYDSLEPLERERLVI